jgi:VWFA-related protein
MFYMIVFLPLSWGKRISRYHLAATLSFLLSLTSLAGDVTAQSFKQELDSPDKVMLSVKNPSGRVNVVASEEQQRKVTIEAESSGSYIGPDEVATVTKGSSVRIEVRPQRSQDRIDLTVRIPLRSKVSVDSEGGAVSVVGNVEEAEVRTNTGTIHADVPLDALKFNFEWVASRPRFLSDVELPEIKEKRGGVFAISGNLGDEKAKRTERTELAFQTHRGIVLLNVDPTMVPSDLRERPLTEAARAIVRSGDSELIAAIRKVSPRMFGDYAKTLPPLEKEPVLLRSQPPGQVVSTVAPQLLRFNASVTDRNGRAIGDMKRTDFVVYENGIERRVTDVVPTSEPFNLVLLLDVSGSVEERMDFIRKAARDFLRTASRQDRIAIISFREDIQVVSDFTTDRQLLSRKLDEIDAGGGTALYDALGYVFSATLKQLRGERTAVVILSDGDDNKSFVPFPALQEAITESGALIYPLYVPSGLIPEASVPRPEITRDPLRTRYLTLTTRADEEGRKLAAVSGGVYYPIRRMEDLQKAYDDVVVQLRTAYTITYASNSTPAGSRRVRVRANREGASVRLSPVVGVANP